MTDSCEYYILTMHPNAKEVFTWIWENNLQYEVHLNRTRFWVPIDSSLHTYYQLWLADSCGVVDPSLDVATGHPR